MRDGAGVRFEEQKIVRAGHRSRSSWVRWTLAAALLAALLGGYWLLPISGQVLIVPGRGSLSWPQMRLAQTAGRTTLWVTDSVPWAYVLATIDGQAAYPSRWWQNSGGTWTWEWTLTAAEAAAAEAGATVVFYHDCHTGCSERGRLAPESLDAATPERAPTKLGVVFADPARDWHGRSGWDVELTYARLPEEEHWGIDDLAARVCRAASQGLRVLVRVDYDRDRSLPPAGDYEALAAYLAYLRRLATDARLQGVYGYIIGSGYNALDANGGSPEGAVTPAWYARLFNGYGESAGRMDNAVQVVRAANPRTRVLVGPVQPFCRDQAGEGGYAINAPWLSYMDDLVAYLDEGARSKAAVGIALAAPDGFALQAPGRPEAAERAGQRGADEPRIDLPRAKWGGAQAGFRVYRDWMTIVNSYSSTRGLPLYITSMNTFAPDEGVPPAQNYSPGWLTAALAVVNEEPQVQALCWFIDGPLGDTQWDGFSLSRRQGRMAEAAEEFEVLLRQGG